MKSKNDSDDIYITFSKRKVLFVIVVLFLLLVISVLRFLPPSSFIQTKFGTVAIAIHTVPLLGKYIPARWLPKAYIEKQVLPPEGFQTKLTLGDLGKKMVEAGVIDRKKLEESYKGRGGVPKEMKQLLTKGSDKAFVVTKENSTWIINVLWPLGLSNKMVLNEKSPIAGKDVGNFASTGGWTLGNEETGGAYFNTLKLIQLSQKEEKRVKALADSIYRPCCDNSSFFQDCNHGSAALALTELGVAQGLSDGEIYKTVLVFNAFWFPQNYTETALYFQYEKNKAWNDIDPKQLLSKEFSSISGWLANVDTPARKIPGLLPKIQGGGSCSV